MTYCPTLVLIQGTPGSAESGVAKLVLRDLSGVWGVTVKRVSLDAMLGEAAILDGATAAWLYAPGLARSSSAVFEAVGRIEEALVPGLLTCGGLVAAAGSPVADGVVEGPMDANKATLSALLMTLLNQGGVMQTLAAETKLLRSQHSGVADQFTKLDEELRMAVKIQREFLPKALPTAGEVAFDVLWQPAGYVGGDIYDVARLDEHHYGIFIADAVGHGVPAALMTIYIKHAMQTRELTPGRGRGYRLLPPGEAIATLNRAMIEQDAGAASLGTAAYGVLDVRTQRLTLARAGHPAPLVLRAEGRTESIEPDGAMLGIFPDEVFEEVSVDLRRGDRVVLYSDGFEVAFPDTDGGRIANERYTAELESLREGDGEHALEALRKKLDRSAGSLNQRDDLTVVCTTATADARVRAGEVEGAFERQRAVA